MRVLIVDDYEPVRRGLRILLSGMKGIEVCGEAGDGSEAIAKANDLAPDAVVMDISMPRLNGIDATREIRRLLPKAQILILSQHDLPQLMTEAKKAGASSYVTKSSIWNRLIPAIQRMQMGDAYRDDEHLGGDGDGDSHHTGAEQDKEILEQALGESEERFHYAFEQTAVGMGHTSAEGAWLRTNQKLSEILGYTKRELHQLRIQDITHPEDLQVELAQNQKVVEGELNHYTVDKRYIRKDGRIVSVRLTVDAVRDPGGRLKYCLRVVQDNSVAKDAEASLARATRELQMSLGHSELMAKRFDAPLTRCSRDLRYMWVNQRYADWLQRPKEKIIGRQIVDVLGNEAFATLRDRFEQVLSGAFVHYQAEANYEKIGLRKIAAWYRPTFDGDGSTDGWVALVEDVTAQEKAKAAVERP